MDKLKTLIVLVSVGLLTISCDDDNLEDSSDARDAHSVGHPSENPESDAQGEMIEDETEEPEVPPVEDPDQEDPTDPTQEPQEPAPPEPCELTSRCINAFPMHVVDTTMGGTRAFDTYSCQPETNEGGPERVYRVELEQAGFLAVEVLLEAPGVDVDVHLLFEEDASTCIDRGNLAAGAYLEAGTYWLAADTWVDSSGNEYAGEFELSVNLTTPESFSAFGMKAELAEDALTGFTTAWQSSETKRFEYTITDFSLHSSQKRQWIVQLATGELLYHLHVGHGEGSIVGADLGFASVFSNVPASHQSSLGMIRTAETYFGDFGYSLRIDGLEPGFNDKVRDRFIVVHPWDGNRQSIIDAQGWVTPSWGCATLAPEVSAGVIDTISDGSLMFFWYPDPTWRQGSSFL